eukprot:6173435-Pleurochrysis_carterae.AAC.1
MDNSTIGREARCRNHTGPRCYGPREEDEEIGHRPVGSRNSGLPSRQSRVSSSDRLNDTEPIERRDLPKELVECLDELGITRDAWLKDRPCRACGRDPPTSKCNKLFVLTRKGREKYEESISVSCHVDGRHVVLMGHLCADGEEHVATDLLPMAEAGMVDADSLVPSRMVLALPH